MRQIKFRGISKATGEWLFGDVVRNVKGDIAVRPPFEMHLNNTCNEYEVNPETIGQFTGLYDRNGREIYEGDILLIKEYYNEAISIFSVEDIKSLTLSDVKGYLDREWTGEVEYDTSCFFVGDTFLNALNGDMRFSQPVYEIELVGNIHDNLELLEEKP